MSSASSSHLPSRVFSYLSLAGTMDPADVDNISLYALIQSSPMDQTVYKLSQDYSTACLATTVVTTFFAYVVLWKGKLRYPNIYRRFILFFIFLNFLDAIIYKLTYVNLVIWHNSIIFYADGFFNGPRAVGVQMVFGSLPMALLCLLNLYKYAQITKSSTLEFLSTPHCLPFIAFWLGVSITLHYGAPVMLFQTDGDSIDRTADLFYWAQGKGRDVGFEHCIGTYWAVDTFVGPKWKPIVGLVAFHLALPLVMFYNLTLTNMIRRAERSQRLYSGKSYKYMVTEPRHLLMFWIQFAISLICVVLPRLILGTLPFFYDCDGLTGNIWGQKMLSRWPMFTVPLRPILSILAAFIVVKDIRRQLKGCFRRRNSSSPSVISTNAVVI